MNLIKSSKKSLLIFILIAIVYLLIIFMRMNICTKVGLVCSEETHYDVPSIYPGSSSCQICANENELTKGYAIIEKDYILYYN